MLKNYKTTYDLTPELNQFINKYKSVKGIQDAMIDIIDPLYHDQYVHEYLRFVGRLNGLKGNKLNERIGEMIDICGLKKDSDSLVPRDNLEVLSLERK